MSTERFIEENTELLFRTLKELCEIPAPSGHEEARAEYCRTWLEREGAVGVFVDPALNVIFPVNCEGDGKITVIAAHTDTVFPDQSPMPYVDDGEKIFCPGAGDDTASLAVLLMTAKYFIESGAEPRNGLMFVCNSCEEGLGNLRGTRLLFDRFGDRIGSFVTFDSQMDKMVDRSVGSHRYEVEVRTEGGHSFRDFGNANAICALSGIISSIYRIEVPKKGESRTTYNVGSILGGTSVNTIAQSAKMLCEYRSDDAECLEFMRKEFARVFAEAESDKVKVNVSKIGDRPCGIISESDVAPLKELLAPAIEEITGRPVEFESGSTDCNVPHSMGIPAVAIGVYFGEGAHTREEWIEKASLTTGLRVALRAAVLLGEAE